MLDGPCLHANEHAGGLGLTALLTADKDPFKSWAKYLAGMKAQVISRLAKAVCQDLNPYMLQL